jgi:hypothetical protein
VINGRRWTQTARHAYLNRIKMQVKVCNSEMPLLNAFAVPVLPGAERMWPEAG